MKLSLRLQLIFWLALCSAAPALRAQQAERPKPLIPRMPSRDLRGFTIPAEPEHPEPGATDYRDPKYKVAFHIPAGWTFEKKDGVLSNFGVEMRSANRKTDVRGVAAINFNPWPVTTFAGAIFYYSVVPRTSAESCTVPPQSRRIKPMPETEISGIGFQHGQDQHGTICTEARDDIFTAMRGNTCLRFDLVVNTFCSEMSGAMEINAAQLKDVETRLAGILGSVKIDLP